MADVLKHLKVKTSTLKRVHKELVYYEKEREQDAAKVQQLKDQGVEECDLKQSENVLAETEMMIPQTKHRLEAALTDLQNFIAENEADIGESEELQHAKDEITSAQTVFQ